MVAQESGPANARSPGLLASFTTDTERDFLVLPNLALFVAAGTPPTAFLSSGNYAVEFKGFVTVELRAQYTFRAWASGQLELQINDTTVLQFTGDGQTAQSTKPIRL